MKYDYAFIVHARYRDDMYRKFPWMRILPAFFINWITLHAPPFVVSRITGLTTLSGKLSTGLVIGVPMTAHQLLEHRSLALKRITKAVQLAQNKGAQYVGLGAMTASLSRGGLDIIDGVPGVTLTTGRTYTVHNIVSYITYFTELFSLNKKEITVGIVGAAGGIGSGTAIWLAHHGYTRFVLIDLERKLEHVQKHIASIEKHAGVGSVEVTHQIGAVSTCHIIVAATSAPEAIIKSADVTPGTIIVNDAQPSDVDPEIVKTREDVLVVEGGVLHAPGINCHFNFGLAGREDIFSCLAETILLAYREHGNHYSIGDFDPTFISTVEQDAKSLGFSIQSPQNERGPLSAPVINSFSKYIKTRYNRD
jgi:predicted amino acid dehydrogenase